MISDPVIGDSFFGRLEVMQLLQTRLAALKNGYRQNIAITGQRLAGKTSLLQQFLFSLDDPGILPIYVEVITEPFRDFAQRFIGTMLFNLLRSMGEEPQEEIIALMSSARKYVPKTVLCVEKIDELVNKGDFEEAYNQLLGLTSLIKEETGKVCIVILDEFHNLAGLDVKNPFNIFGKKIMIQKDTMYIVTSSQINALKQILAEKLSLLFGNFQTVELRGFDCASSNKFLKDRITPVELDDANRKFMIDISSGYPFHLDVFARRIKELSALAGDNCASRKLIIDAFESLLFEPKGALSQHYQSTVGYMLEDPVYSSYGNILMAMAHGNHTLQKITGWMGRQKDISKQLVRLVELNIVFKNGGSYLFYDKLLGFWLKEVYQLRKGSILSHPRDKSRKFRENLDGLMDRSITEYSKTTEDRLEQLLKLCDNDIVETEFKARRLSKFLKIERRPSEGPGYVMVAHAKDGCWVIRVSEKEVDENEIAEFTVYCKGLKDKTLRKVIVAAGGIDTNARILAKEAKLWVWGIEDLNMISDLFCKPRVVLCA